MGIEEKIDIDVFKVVTRAIAQSDNMDIMDERTTWGGIGGISGTGLPVRLYVLL